MERLEPRQCLAVVGISGDAQVAEGAVAVPFQVTLSEPLAVSCSVAYTTGTSSALLNVDYRLSSGGAVGTLTFAPGETSKTILVSVLDDRLVERTERVGISLRNPRNCTLGTSQATLVIEDDDAYSVAVTGAEEGVTRGRPAVLTVELSKPAASAKSFSVTAVAETARPGRDFVSFVRKVVTVKPGETTATFSISTLGSLAEDDRTFSVRVTPLTAEASAPGLHRVRINGNQPAISVSDTSAWEGNGVGGTELFRVWLSTAATVPVSVAYQTIDRSASAADNDYVASSGSVTFAPGETEKTVSVNLVGDYKVESDESFLLVLGSPIGASLRRPIGVGVILSEDVRPSVFISDVRVAEGNSGATLATFVVSLSVVTSVAINVPYSTSDGTATVSDRDYVATSGILVFAPGETEKTVSVTVLGDVKFEQDETFSLQLSAPLNAQLVQSFGTATVVNDDQQPSPLPGTYSPSQIRHAYGFDLVAGDGTGTTIAIVNAYHSPTIEQDLKAFDEYFGIPAPPKFTIIDQYGSSVPAPNAPAGTNWALEITLDVQWAHAIAPGASILLVEARSSSAKDLYEAVLMAASKPNVVVVSNSWGGFESQADSSKWDGYFATPPGHKGITFVCAAGDHGDVLYPAVSANVLSVGGTQAFIDSEGDYQSERVWNDVDMTTGGGVSKYVPKPAFQSSVNTGGNYRGAVDVAFSARDFVIYQTYGGAGWANVRGTSASCPVWAGLIAIADGLRMSSGRDPLANAQAALYELPSTDFHDITVGNNAFGGDLTHPSNGGGHSAKVGYDVVSGLGSPYADRVINDLVNRSLRSQPVGVTSSVRSAMIPATLGAASRVVFALAGGPRLPVDAESVRSSIAANTFAAIGSAGQPSLRSAGLGNRMAALLSGKALQAAAT